MGKLANAVACGRKMFVNEDFAGIQEGWVSLDGCTFVNCSFRNARIVGTGLNIKGSVFRYDYGTTGDTPDSLLSGLVIEERNVEVFASSLQFNLETCEDLEERLDTERGLGIGYPAPQILPRDLLTMNGVLIIPDEDGLVEMIA